MKNKRTEILDEVSPAYSAPAVGLSDVDALVSRLQTPKEIADDWYKVDEIHHALRHAGSGNFGAADQIPTDVKSREFAEWMTKQYRLAMAKGILLGRRGE